MSFSQPLPHDSEKDFLITSQLVLGHETCLLIFFIQSSVFSFTCLWFSAASGSALGFWSRGLVMWPVPFSCPFPVPGVCLTESAGTSRIIGSTYGERGCLCVSLHPVLCVLPPLLLHCNLPWCSLGLRPGLSPFPAVCVSGLPWGRPSFLVENLMFRILLDLTVLYA